MKSSKIAAFNPQDELERSELKGAVQEFERNLILRALEATGGHQRHAARMLGMFPSTLNEKLKRLGLLDRARPRWRPHHGSEAVETRTNAFRYCGRLTPGRTLEVKGVPGPVEVLSAVGNEYELIGFCREGTLSSDHVAVEVVQGHDGVTISLRLNNEASESGAPFTPGLALSIRIPVGVRILLRPASKTAV